MSERWRAWHFLHPDLDVPRAAGPGLQLAPGGGIDTVTGAAAVRQAILLLLTTRPGERVMRPDYGCNLHRLAFAPNDATTHGLAMHYVRRALERWEPRIDLLALDARADPAEPARLVLELEYRVRATQRVETLTYALDLTRGVGGGAD